MAKVVFGVIGRTLLVLTGLLTTLALVINTRKVVGCFVFLMNLQVKLFGFVEVFITH
jgi:hypothetical protein